MKPLIQEMAKLADERLPFVLATVIRRNGSAPRSAGARMLVKPDGDICGSVGGGILEAQVRQRAARVLADGRTVIEPYQFDGSAAASMDAICGGQVKVLMERWDPADPAVALLIQGLQDACTNHRKAWLATLFGAQPGSEHVLIRADGPMAGSLPAGLNLEQVLETRLPALISLENLQAFLEPVQPAGSVVIFGAGHVSRSLAEFTRAVGFWTVVVDDRAEYANPERFPLADEIIVLDSFRDWAGKIALDRDSYVVIVTRGHQNDLTVLAQAIQVETAYMGMIGSRRKCALIFDELRRMGVSEERLRAIHAPIGLPIEAETPEEIGISITAELIQARAAIQRMNSSGESHDN